MITETQRKGGWGSRSWLVLIVLAAVILRYFDWAEFQIPNQLPDEKSWLFIGTSLISEGKPMSWTVYSHPPGLSQVMCHAVASPFLGHPPLFALLIGGWATVVGQTNWCDIDWSWVRLPMAVIAALTMTFTYLLVKRIGGQRQALFTLAAYAFFPSHVLAYRLVAAEHFLALMLVLAWYGWLVRETTDAPLVRKAWGVGLFLISLVAPLVKLTGVVVGGALLLTSVWQRKYRLAAVMVLALTLAGWLFMGYGWLYDWELFVQIMKDHHSDIPQSFAHFWTIFTHLNIGHYGLYDVSMIVGMIGVIAMVAQRKEDTDQSFGWSALLVVSFLFLYVAPVFYFGWYKFLIYPFIAMGLGYLWERIYRGQVAYLVLFLPMLNLMMEYSQVLSDRTLLRIMMACFYGLTVLAIWPRWRWLGIKPLFLSQLLFLWGFEAIWLARLINYPWTLWLP